VRRSAYEAELAATPYRIVVLRRALTRAALGFVETLRFVKSEIRRLAALLLGWLSHFSRLAYAATVGRLGRGILAYLFAHRAGIRGWITKLVPVEATLTQAHMPHMASPPEG
jgi:hypothetical protein